MSAGKRYRKVVEEKREALDALKVRLAEKDTQSLSCWFNDIAAGLPVLMERLIEVEAKEAAQPHARFSTDEDRPRLYWTYPGYGGDFSDYKGEYYTKTDGFKAFQRACQALDISCTCDIEDGYDMADSRIRELVVRVDPKLAYGGA